MTQTPSEAPSRRLSVDVPEPLHHEARVAAVRSRRTLRELVIEGLRDKLAELQREGDPR